MIYKIKNNKTKNIYILIHIKKYLIRSNNNLYTIFYLFLIYIYTTDLLFAIIC